MEESHPEGEQRTLLEDHSFTNVSPTSLKTKGFDHTIFLNKAMEMRLSPKPMLPLPKLSRSIAFSQT